jgi:hypothetical protein
MLSTSNNAAANLNSASHYQLLKPKPNQVRVNVTEDDEGDTSATLTRRDEYAVEWRR